MEQDKHPYKYVQINNNNNNIFFFLQGLQGLPGTLNNCVKGLYQSRHRGNSWGQSQNHVSASQSPPRKCWDSELQYVMAPFTQPLHANVGIVN
jgi:hypothetical protein